jgi:ribosomal protein S18 acetylase RimI-like enzyme
VAEHHRREGVGRLLMAGVRSVVARNGATLIELVATRANVAAREFYRSLGFVEAHVISLEFVGSPEDPPDPEE